ncbi:putative K+-dependent Na+/Ca+ exchanger [Candidatus Desulfarcum epimagneticum]|uniref:Putative K+-dependent Na+/Ca+ exchanger n=1 Tax=uncultured Desulfobacteraceae bacterium TaxID=218296 RepID=A0A484HHJ6_9BACT|nr:putative K+-dependent Na+/Ca+ exchanger [uncultured Desulfobacteraceae bacterium]
MEMFSYLFLFCAAGFILLYYGAEWLVKGSSSLAGDLGVTPIVIGLTVVAFGTSAPELVVSVISSVRGKSMIAVGNVIGSNICNIALVLGMSCFLRPIECAPSIVRRDIPLMLAISLYLFLISINSVIGRLEGATLFAGIILYTLYNYRGALNESGQGDVDRKFCIISEVKEIGCVNSRKTQIFLILTGIAGVTSGAELVVDSATKMMKILGVGEKFIGLTIVAFGTSLPELATSVVAAMRKEMDISVGNLVGSNVFNILSVLGAASLVRPIHIPGGFFQSGLIIDYAVMMAISALPWLMMRKTPVLTKKDGLILLACYTGYIGWLIAKA